MRLTAAVVAFVSGESMNVARVCRENSVSRKTFYKYARRYEREGLAGFEPRSRRPLCSPAATSSAIEYAVIELRKGLADLGVDHGATTIQWHLQRDKRFGRAVPSISTVHRILVRRGFVTPQPSKRPKSSWKRFEADAPNVRWQIDATEWLIQTGVVRVFNIIDDHSRLACRSRAVEHETTIEAWTTFCQAATRWGVPGGVLSDNGLCFSGKLRGIEVGFEANLRDAGVEPRTGRPFHPQTTGKVERFQQTLKKWLRHRDDVQGIATSIAELQQRLDEFCDYYNHQRPHQGIGRRTPIERWTAQPPGQPSPAPLEHPYRPSQHHTATVDQNGTIYLGKIRIAVGARWAGCTITAITDNIHATVLAGDHLIRHFEIDHTRSYQPSGHKRGGPKHPRHLPS